MRGEASRQGFVSPRALEKKRPLRAVAYTVTIIRVSRHASIDTAWPAMKKRLEKAGLHPARWKVTDLTLKSRGRAALRRGLELALAVLLALGLSACGGPDQDEDCTRTCQAGKWEHGIVCPAPVGISCTCYNLPAGDPAPTCALPRDL